MKKNCKCWIKQITQFYNYKIMHFLQIKYFKMNRYLYKVIYIFFFKETCQGVRDCENRETKIRKPAI